MKLNLDERLAKGVAITYTHENRGDCPAYIDKILAIPGVSSVFRVEDFMAIQRKPTAGWEDILSQARAVLEYAGRLDHDADDRRRRLARHVEGDRPARVVEQHHSQSRTHPPRARG